jgi:hypothetical protein
LAKTGDISMSNTARETALINFGRAVLNELALADTWSGNTFQAIADIAEAHGLSETDQDGLFAIVPDPQ